MNIREIFRVRSRSGDVGVEIELEGSIFTLDSDNWRSEGDGSLRGGLEFVMNKPVTFSKLPKVLGELEDHLKETSVVEYSHRAGTHVHINVQKLTVRELFNYICAFICVEEILTDWCHPFRSGNHFCLRAIDAENLIDFLTKVAKHSGLNMLRDEVQENTVRYSGMNVVSIPKYGSLEFRTLESTIDMDRITTWAGVLLNIRDEAKTFNSPIDLIESTSRDGAEQFVNKLLGPYVEDFKKDGWEKKFRTGMRLAQQIAYSRSWQPSKNIFDDGVNIFT